MFSRRHNANAFPPPAGRRGGAKGFTLMELLVALVLLAFMVSIVSTVLSQSSNLVTFSETKIRQNNAAYSLSQVFRDYLRRASKDGILCIAEVPTGLPSPRDWAPRLILTTTGTASSITGTGKGNAAFTILGLVPNRAASLTEPNLLWMPTRVLAITADRGANPGSDLWPWPVSADFSTFQGLTRAQVDAWIIESNMCTGTATTAGKINNDLLNLQVPATTVGNGAGGAGLLWQLAATGVSDLSILWTDGNTSGTPATLNWYGRDKYGTLTAKDNSTWAGRTRADLHDNDPVSLSQFEFRAADTGYRALWTHANQNYWPKAIKIRFTFTDASLPPDYQKSSYEVIGTIGQ